MARPRLSVCIVAKNEEENIRRALSSVRHLADEIILVDTGSTDNTIAIAESYGATVVHHPWNDDFSAVRNAALDHVTGEWVLMLDADEAVSETMAKSLPKRLADPQAEGYLNPVVNYIDGRRATSAGVVRLFRNRPAYRFVGRVHEQISESIEAAGGRIKPDSLVIEHYGYTDSEDQRKGRRERNMRLLELTLQEDPNRASTWFFLGQEHMALREYGQGAACFRKSLSLNQHNDMRTIYAAHRLVEIGVVRNRLTDGWEMAARGRENQITRWDSLFRTSQTALFEGDYLAASQALAALRKAPETDFGYASRTPSILSDMEAAARWEEGRRAEALSLWQRAMADDPADHHLAVQWVRHKVLAEGLQPTLTAVLRANRTPQLISATVGTLLRAGEFDLAVTLSRNSLQWGFSSPYLLYGMARAGMWDEAERIASNSGVNGEIHLATAAVWFNQPDVAVGALGRLTGSWKATFETIVAGDPLPEELLWSADILMSLWADAGCMVLLQAGGRSLHRDQGAGMARAAWLLARAGMTASALELALNHPDQPDSQEILGLTAAEQGDHVSASHFLVQRAERGPAPVRVYHQAAGSLRALGREQEARVVLERGRTHRPHSLLLRRL